MKSGSLDKKKKQKGINGVTSNENCYSCGKLTLHSTFKKLFFMSWFLPLLSTGS